VGQDRASSMLDRNGTKLHGSRLRGLALARQMQDRTKATA
jgi:hypothetical protein